MMDLELVRFGSTPYGTFGKLLIPQGPDIRKFYTVERPWLDNEVGVSCVPLGEYGLIWLPTTTPVPAKYNGHTWYLEGDTVGLEPGQKQRSRVAVHIGNTMADLRGCIAPGANLTSLEGAWGVGRSRASMDDIYALLGPEHHRLTISAAPMG